jgi:hypothetical protein
MKRKKVPAKKIINPKAIITGPVKMILFLVLNIFSCNKKMEIIKIKTDSTPVGIESNKSKELVRESKKTITKKSILSNVTTTFNLLL